MSIISSTLSHLTKLFLSANCPLCQRSASKVLCSACHQQLLGCRQSAHGNGQPKPIQQRNTLDIFAWGHYQGLLKQALTQLKYGDQAELGLWLGLELGNYWRKHPASHRLQQASVVPIPLHQQRHQQRGYNQAALIAKGVCKATGLHFAEHGLMRTKNTQAMYSLGVEARQTNLHKAFRLGPKPPSPSKPIILIDDIYTTGTTALTAAETLRTEGYRVPAIMAVAQTKYVAPVVDRSKPDHGGQILKPRLIP